MNMKLSLVSQKPLAAATRTVLAALRASTEYERYFSGLRVLAPDKWQPLKGEVAILLMEKGDEQWPSLAWSQGEEALGLPVLPLLVQQPDGAVACGPDVRDPRFYFVSNGIVLNEAELADPACGRVLQSKLESYFPLLSRLTLLRQRQSPVLLS